MQITYSQMLSLLNKVLVRVPTKYGKADLTIYKKAGNAVVRVLKTRAAACEKRSVDEVAIDITPEADRLLEQVIS